MPFSPDERPPNRGRLESASGSSETVVDREGLVVVAEQNDHGALTLRDPETRETYHVVRYASPELRERAEHLKRGASVDLRLSRVGSRANAWRADRLFIASG
jgi:hypothetical protein